MKIGKLLIPFGLTVIVLSARGDVYRVGWGPYPLPEGPTNGQACTDLNKIWYSTKQAACSAAKALQPACDRSTATYFNQQAVDYGSYCAVSWQFIDNNSPSNTPPRNWSVNASYSICGSGYEVVASTGNCVRIVELDHTKSRPLNCAQPGFGNPIFPLTGTKRETVALDGSIGGIPLELTYDTASKVPVSGTQAATTEIYFSAFGDLWYGSLHRRLVLDAGLKSARISHGDGEIIGFTGNGAGAFYPDGNFIGQLQGVGQYYVFTDGRRMQQEYYDTAGQLAKIVNASGAAVFMSYSDSGTPSSVAPGPNYLIAATDSFGRSVYFYYNVQGQVVKVAAPSGNNQILEYNAGNLSKIAWSDLSSRAFLYSNLNVPWALTGISDEMNAISSSFVYDSQGRAVSTERAGGIDHYAVSYSSPPSIVVADTYSSTDNVIYRVRNWQMPVNPLITSPNESALALGLALAANSPALTSRSQPAGSGCAASTSAQSYDTNGNLASRDDFNGYRVCYANDPLRNLEIARVEGLAGGAACGVTAAGSALPVGARKINTQWHPDWSLPVKVAEPGRITTSVYNGQPDPFAGGALASCASAAATLPDGKPIAVLCRQIEVATTDVDGSQGFAAQAQTSVAMREQHWTYNQVGQMVSATDPVGNTTTYAYYTDTSPALIGTDPNAVGHTKGDLASMTNAAGHPPTLYTLYNKAGQVLQMQDPNGVVTVNQYDTRQRLVSATTGGQSTAYAYWPTGLLQSVTQPDGSFVSYQYDDAHRLVQVADNLGNSITYTLDNLGNRTVEAVKDPANTLRRSLGRGIDALGRVQQVTGRQ